MRKKEKITVEWCLIKSEELEFITLQRLYNYMHNLELQGKQITSDDIDEYACKRYGYALRERLA